MKKYILLAAFLVLGFVMFASQAEAAGRCYANQSATCTTSGAFGQCRTCEVCDDGAPSTCYSMQVCSGCMTAAQMDDLATRRAICKCNWPDDYIAHCGNINAAAAGGSSSLRSGGIAHETCPAPSVNYEYNGIQFEPK